MRGALKGHSDNHEISQFLKSVVFSTSMNNQTILFLWISLIQRVLSIYAQNAKNTKNVQKSKKSLF
jgi:hypothetical protein